MITCKECGGIIEAPFTPKECCMCHAVLCQTCANSNMTTFSIAEGPQGNADICESCYKRIIPGSEEWNGGRSAPTQGGINRS